MSHPKPDDRVIYSAILTLNSCLEQQEDNRSATIQTMLWLSDQLSLSYKEALKQDSEISNAIRSAVDLKPFLSKEDVQKALKDMDDDL